MSTNISTTFIRSAEDARHQAALPCHDHQEPEEVLHVRGASARRQERPPPLPRLQLPEHDARQAVHLHHAHAS